jgi:hypothetical protein
MTPDRKKSGIKVGKIGVDKITAEDLTGKKTTHTLKEETEIKDDDGNIIGVLKRWQ